MADVKLREGILFWTLHWAASGALKADPEQIIHYYIIHHVSLIWPLVGKE